MKIVWTYLALRDLEDAYEFVADNSPKAASGMIDRIEKALSNLKIYPNVGRKGRIEGTRELIIPNTSFIFSYRVKETHIEILAFLHGRRKWP
ncbi:MAG: type II toxin-antitoxin system RelE/ParE family toxin [Proteobacteria bacterium]|nr:type II toxin-antitoxin system RelE/ParE family toxin [Pseudomonadota bacterium]